MPLKVRRLLDQPIIKPHMDVRMGDNINGPSLVRMPDWAEGRLGRYHLYFSHHKGRYIRLAYADALTGPWIMHEPGVFDITESLFPAEDPPEPAPEDRPAWAKSMKGGYLYAHIASPDVHIDHETRRFQMYYHGLIWNGDQLTRLATSTDGLTFRAHEPMLGAPYFRVVRHGGYFYSMAWGGVILRSQTWEGPFEEGPQLVPFHPREGIGEGYRHGESHVVGDTLHIFYTRMGDRPERILHSTIDMRGDWQSWKASDPVTLMEPELAWEGTDLPLEVSTMGTETTAVRQLRDPAIFVDDDAKTYLLYCGRGELGIGIAELEGL